MSEYKRQIAAGATVAVVVVFVLALGVSAFFPEATTSESLTTTATATSGTLTTSSSTPLTSSASSSSSVPSSGTSSSTATSSGVGTTSTTTTVPATSATVSLTSTTMTVSASTTTTTLTTTAVTTVCYTCGILKIESVNLTVGAAGNRTILSLTIANNGSESISNLSVSLASTVVVVIPALAAGTQVWVSIQVPDSQSIEAGQSYQVIIQGGYGSYTTGAITTVEASGS